MTADSNHEAKAHFFRMFAEVQEELLAVPAKDQPAHLQRILAAERKKLEERSQKEAFDQKVQELEAEIKRARYLEKDRQHGYRILMPSGGFLGAVAAGLFFAADVAAIGGVFTVLSGMSAVLAHRLKSDAAIFSKQAAELESQHRALIKSLPAPVPLSSAPPQLSALMKLAGPAESFNADKKEPSAVFPKILFSPESNRGL